MDKGVSLSHPLDHEGSASRRPTSLANMPTDNDEAARAGGRRFAVSGRNLADLDRRCVYVVWSEFRFLFRLCLGFA